MGLLGASLALAAIIRLSVWFQRGRSIARPTAGTWLESIREIDILGRLYDKEIYL